MDRLLTASITPTTDVVNACLNRLTTLCTRCQIDYYLQQYALIPAFCNGILTAAAVATATAAE